MGILRERAEVATLLGRERSEVQVKWDHRVLRRTSDEDDATRSGLRFHRDKVPDDLEDRGVLCVFTVITVLENDDPGGSIEGAGTVFKLDKLFGSGKRLDPQQIIDYHAETPNQDDGFMYWFSRSIPGTATIFNNFDDSSCWSCADEDVTIDYSL